MPNNNGKRTTLGEGISRKAHAPQILASSRLLRALRRKPITGMEDSRPAGLEGYKAHIALDADGRSVCHIRADLQPESDQATASVAHVSWIVGQMQALPKKTMWGNDNGWPVEAQYIQLHVESADEAPPLQTAIPLEDAKSQVGWRRLRQALDSSSDKPGVFYILSATGTALIVIGLSLLFCSFGFGERLRRPIIHAGQCALTLYVGHILVGWTIIDILDKSSEQTLAFVLTACVICWWIGISFAALWRSIFRRGPLEMFMRSIT
jgi:hypothetical protein